MSNETEVKEEEIKEAETIAICVRVEDALFFDFKKKISNVSKFMNAALRDYISNGTQPIEHGKTKCSKSSLTVRLEKALVEEARNKNINISDVINEAIYSCSVAKQKINILPTQPSQSDDAYGIRKLGLDPNYKFAMYTEGPPHLQTLEQHVKEAFDTAEKMSGDERCNDTFERNIRWCATRMRILGVENADNIKQIKLGAKQE